MKHTKGYAGFTLVELLVVITIISTLAAILFPVFAGAREKARTAVCTSNLRQIGMAMSMYMQDSDGFYPWAKDPFDEYSTMWDKHPEQKAKVATMGRVQDVLSPYIKAPALWRCPSDTGFQYGYGFVFGSMVEVKLDAAPTMFEKYHTSYEYRTEIPLRGKTEADLTGVDPDGGVHGPSEISIVDDGCANWHGSRGMDRIRNAALMGDGHVAVWNSAQFFADGFLKIQ